MKVFKEEQIFRQTWLIIVLVICSIIPITSIIQKCLKENATISTKELVTTTLVIIVSISIIFFFKLTTKIDDKGIHYQFFPLHFSIKSIPWSEISKVGIRTYYPISEFGGWGLRGGFFFNKGKGKAINVSGNIGIQLELKNGEKLLIGTQMKSKVTRVLETYKNKIL